ncbi:hypothetical protein E2C01_096221 [Portunus trituberculatus]|uniref:Uncharacterized protein n=1 Tax=Portunus trituberculatus TaxID=210409 RepID=A0A5B7K607_PORTR|nr:hypothetical protein [Portunus trituberculatus]
MVEKGSNYGKAKGKNHYNRIPVRCSNLLLVIIPLAASQSLVHLASAFDSERNLNHKNDGKS